MCPTVHLSCYIGFQPKERVKKVDSQVGTKKLEKANYFTALYKTTTTSSIRKARRPLYEKTLATNKITNTFAISFLGHMYYVCTTFIKKQLSKSF